MNMLSYLRMQMIDKIQVQSHAKD